VLGADQAAVLFQVPRPSIGRAGGRSWLLTVTRERASIYELPAASWIERAVRLFNGLVETEGSDVAGSASRLYDLLLADAIAGLGPEIRSLIIVPDRSLHLLPFGALRASPQEEPLGARLALSIVPSATVWTHLRGASREAKSASALILADPGAEPVREERRGEGPAERSAIQDLGALPFARKEARSVVRRVGGDSRWLAGVEASEAALKQARLSEFGVLHLAAHAVVDSEQPHRSGIWLTPGSEAEDGLLQVREVAELDLEGQLVVLSACRTAGGVVLVGEGPMSLARPFLQAGASTVVASLWPLPDRAAAELFDDFYRHLAEGLSVAVAMSRTRRELARRGSPMRAWAGVVVLGDGDRVPIPAGARTPLWRSGPVVSLMLMAFGAVLLLGRRLLRG